MTPDPDARCVVTRSAVRGTSPSPGVYEVVKISTTAGPTSRAVASSELLRSAAVAVGAAAPRARLTQDRRRDQNAERERRDPRVAAAAADESALTRGFSVGSDVSSIITAPPDCESRAVPKAKPQGLKRFHCFPFRL